MTERDFILKIIKRLNVEILREGKDEDIEYIEFAGDNSGSISIDFTTEGEIIRIDGWL